MIAEQRCLGVSEYFVVFDSITMSAVRATEKCKTLQSTFVERKAKCNSEFSFSLQYMHNTTQYLYISIIIHIQRRFGISDENDESRNYTNSLGR